MFLIKKAKRNFQAQQYGGEIRWSKLTQPHISSDLCQRNSQQSSCITISEPINLSAPQRPLSLAPRFSSSFRIKCWFRSLFRKELSNVKSSWMLRQAVGRGQKQVGLSFHPQHRPWEYTEPAWEAKQKQEMERRLRQHREGAEALSCIPFWNSHEREIRMTLQTGTFSHRQLHWSNVGPAGPASALLESDLEPSLMCHTHLQLQQVHADFRTSWPWGPRENMFRSGFSLGVWPQSNAWDQGKVKAYNYSPVSSHGSHYPMGENPYQPGHPRVLPSHTVFPSTTPQSRGITPSPQLTSITQFLLKEGGSKQK